MTAYFSPHLAAACLGALLIGAFSSFFSGLYHKTAQDFAASQCPYVVQVK